MNFTGEFTLVFDVHNIQRVRLRSDTMAGLWQELGNYLVQSGIEAAPVATTLRLTFEPRPPSQPPPQPERRVS